MKTPIKSPKKKTSSIVFIAQFVVLITVCAWISIPTTIPFTMQTFAVFLAFAFLGGKRGTACVFAYLLLGFIGAPVFANFHSGIGAIMGAGGGYLLGWIASGLVFWLFEKLLGKGVWAQALSMLIGLFVCYLIGTLWFAFIYTQTAQPIGLWTALLTCVLPFLLPDLVKLALALWLSRRLKTYTAKRHL